MAKLDKALEIAARAGAQKAQVQTDIVSRIFLHQPKMPKTLLEKKSR